MKKSVSIMLFMSLLFSMFASVGHAATPSPKLYLNGTQLQSDVDPQIVNGYTLVPLAILSDSLGYDVLWEDSIQKVTVTKNSTIIELIIGQSSVRVNDEILETEEPPRLINKRTMVPVRFVGELLGLEFEWKHQEWEVHMYQKEPEPEPAEPEAPVEPEEPQATTGYIHSVTMNENSVISIRHSGATKPGKPLVLDYLNLPKRLVFDLPNTTFIPELFDRFEEGKLETEVEDNELLSAFRYSQFSFSPLTARVVVVIGADTGYVITEYDNEIQIALMPSDQVPPDETETELPADPGGDPVLPDDGDNKHHIVIDAGHGGKDPGAVNRALNLREKDFNLSMALKLKAELEKDERFQVHLTRSDDTFVELVDRIAFAEHVKADLFISIHANSLDRPAINGVETYYERPESKAFADIIHKYVLSGTGLNDRKVKKAAFKVIKETTMPAVLIEAGYLSNEKDAKTLFTGSVQDKLAAEIAKGVKEYLNLK